MSTHGYSYQNLRGETCRLFFDPVVQRAVVTSSDVDWERTPVYEGTACSLILTDDEQAWLSETWSQFSAEHSELAVYAGRPTGFREGTGHCQLMNDYCPLCLRLVREFDIHHCVASCDGGPDTGVNLLKICRSCHVVMSGGCFQDRVSKEAAAFWHQIMHFGYRFFPPEQSRNRRHPTVSFYERRPKLRKLVDLFLSTPEHERVKVDAEIRSLAKIQYQHYRDIALGIWPFPHPPRLEGNLGSDA